MVFINFNQILVEHSVSKQWRARSDNAFSLKRLLKIPKFGFQDRLSLNAGQLSLNYHMSLRILFTGRSRQSFLYVQPERQNKGD